MQSSFNFMICFLLVQVIQNVSDCHQILPWINWASATYNREPAHDPTHDPTHEPAHDPTHEPAQTTSGRDPNPITTHVLDTALGVPAASVRISLYRMGSSSSSWIPVNSKLTNKDGRASEFLTGDELDAGIYKIVFNTADYFAKQKTTAFHPFIEVIFEIQDPNEHYHIALTVSAFSYSTYRGS